MPAAVFRLPRAAPRGGEVVRRRGPLLMPRLERRAVSGEQLDEGCSLNSPREWLSQTSVANPAYRGANLPLRDPCWAVYVTPPRLLYSSRFWVLRPPCVGSLRR